MKRKTEYWWMRNTLKEYVYETIQVDKKDHYIEREYVKQGKKVIDYTEKYIDVKGK